MAVANSLRKPQEKKNAQLVSFQANGATVELSPQIVRDYLVSGDKERVSMQEIVYQSLQVQWSESMAPGSLLYQVWQRACHYGHRQGGL